MKFTWIQKRENEWVDLLLCSTEIAAETLIFLHELHPESRYRIKPE